MHYTLPLLLASSALAFPTTTTGSTATKREAGATVTNGDAFNSGAGNNDNANTKDGIGAGSDSYTCYYGGWQSFPDKSKWVSFEDMWNNNKVYMKQACSNLGISPDDTDDQIGYIYDAIQSVTQDALVDHRFILATVMQESNGCVNVGTTNNGVSNPGLMQSHDGASFVGSDASVDEQKASIRQMIVDGTQGTSSGDGQVQGINQYGNIYEAARYYNSGQVNSDDLNDAQGATASYVTDIANRMTGWIVNGGYDQC